MALNRQLSFILVLIAHQATSLTLELVRTVLIDRPINISIDRTGQVYHATYNGVVARYDPMLDKKEDFSPPNPATCNLLEAWQGLRIFTFHREMQLFRLINRNLSLHEDYRLQGEVGFIELATPAFDNNLWLIDITDFTLKKFQLFSNTILSRTPLDLVLSPVNYDILYMKEFQNNIFVSSKTKGILIFDNLGNFVKTYPFKNISHFGFDGEEMYFLSDNHIILINLYTDNQRSISIPAGPNWLFVSLAGEKTYLYTPNSLSLYKTITR